MRVSDKIDPHGLERRELHLAILAILVIAVMSIGMAAAMYPLVFSHPITPETETARRAFYGFCILSVLLVTYLINRQVVIRKLHHQIAEGQKRMELVRRQASTDLLRTLPGMSRFQDRLTMELRRCGHTGDRLYLLLILVSPSKDLAAQGDVSTPYGDAAKALILRLRREDAIYGFQPGGFAVVLVGPDVAAVAQITERLIQSLDEARAVGGRFSFETRVIKYPEEANTAWEMEQTMRAFLPIDQAASTASAATSH